MSGSGQQTIYVFEGFHLDAQHRILSRANGEAISVSPKVLDTLFFFVEHPGELLSKETLLEVIWPNVIVEENNLNQAVSALRRVLGEVRGEHRFIVTEPGRGYRFVASVSTLPSESGSPAQLDNVAPIVTAPGTVRQGRATATRRGKRTIEYALVGALLIVMLLFGGNYVLENATRSEAAMGQEDIAAPVEKSVVVLPFTDVSESGDQAWVAGGLTEEILHSLAQLPELHVTARYSSFRFKGDEREIGEIAATLNVAHVLKGSVRRIGDQLRVSVQLIRASDGAYLWTNAYDRTINDLFDVQRDVAEEVASALDLVLDESRRERMFGSGTRNVEAFEAYQRGWAIYQAVHYEKTDQTLWDANRHFERAIALDPHYAEAAMLHSDVFAHQVVRGPGELAVNSPHSQEEALALLLKDIDFASVNAPSSTDWLVAEIYREVFSQTWYRLPDLIERLREDGDLNSVNIETAGALSFILRVTANLDLLRELTDRQLAVDRLAVESWIAKAHVELIAGDIAALQDVVVDARRTLGAQDAMGDVERFAAILQGRRSELIRLLGDPPTPGPYLMALKGDYETALRLARERENHPHWLAAGLGCLLAYNEMGAADRTRRVAKRIDQLPGGSAVFVSFLAGMGNALLFDLKDTPNFAAQLQQAGIDPAIFKRVPRSALE